MNQDCLKVCNRRLRNSLQKENTCKTHTLRTVQVFIKISIYSVKTTKITATNTATTKQQDSNKKYNNNKDNNNKDNNIKDNDNKDNDNKYNNNKDNYSKDNNNKDLLKLLLLDSTTARQSCEMSQI